MKKLIGIGMLMWLVFGLGKIACPDDGYFGGRGETVYPLYNDQIEMVSEEVKIKEEEKSWQVECQFIFHNTGKEAVVQMGFPNLPSGPSYRPVKGETSIKHFRAYIDGNLIKNVELKKGEVNKIIPELYYGEVFIWNVPFKANETKNLKNTYSFGKSMYGEEGEWITYVLKTGALWKGRIKEADITVQFLSGRNPTHIVRKIKPEGYSFKENKITWHFTDFEPEEDILIEYIPISILEELKKKEKIIKNSPKSSEMASEQLTLGRRYGVGKRKEILMDLIKNYPDTTYAADAYYRLGKYPEACEIYAHIFQEIKEGKKTSDADFWSIGQILRDSICNYDLAIDAYQLALSKKMDPWKASHTSYVIGECYQKKGDIEKAILWYLKTVNGYNNPVYCSKAQSGIGEMYWQKGDYLKAIAEFQKVIDNYPEEKYICESAKARIVILNQYQEYKEVLSTISQFMVARMNRDMDTSLSYLTENALQKGFGGDRTEALIYLAPSVIYKYGILSIVENTLHEPGKDPIPSKNVYLKIYIKSGSYDMQQNEKLSLRKIGDKWFVESVAKIGFDKDSLVWINLLKKGEYLGKTGLTVDDLIADLMKHNELIPYPGTLGSTMKFYFYSEKDIYVLSNGLVRAHFDDGHIDGWMLLEYQVTDEGKISWKVLDSYLE